MPAIHLNTKEMSVCVCMRARVCMCVYVRVHLCASVAMVVHVWLYGLSVCMCVQSFLSF